MSNYIYPNFPSKEEFPRNDFYFNRYLKTVGMLKNREFKEEEVFEKHHLVPKSLGGSNDPENILRIPARWHYHLHFCLWKCFSGKMGIAFSNMTYTRGFQEKLNAKQYELMQKDFHDYMSEINIGEKNPFYGKTHNEEVRKKISENIKQAYIDDPLLAKRLADKRRGRPLSEEHKAKLRGYQPWLGKHHSEETKEKISKKNKKYYENHHPPNYGEPRSEEVKEKLREANLGKKQSQETIDKRLKSRGGKFKVKVICIETGEIFESIQFLANTLDISYKVIYGLINEGKERDGKTYKRYEEED